MTLISILIWTLLCCCLQGFSGQRTVTQFAAKTSSLGSTVTLTCNINPKVKSWSTGTSRVQWYQQKSGQAPKWAIKYGKDPTDDFSSRFSGRGNGQNNEMNISGVQAEDAAVYYCKAYEQINSAWVYTFGGGTKLIIHSGPMVRPSVSLLPPSSEQLSGGSATLACLLSGYSPQGAVVSWEVDGTEVTEGVLSSSEEEKSGRYSSSSTLSLSRESWMKGELYSCRVLHHEHRESRSLHRSQCQD